LKEVRSELGGGGGEPAVLDSRPDRGLSWLLPSLVALVAAGGVLLIEGESAQVAFLAGLCVLALLSDLLPGAQRRREREEASGSGFDWTVIVPVALALVLARLTFDSDDDARLAALFVMAGVFSAAWRRLRIGERLRGDRPRDHAGGGST